MNVPDSWLLLTIVLSVPGLAMCSVQSSVELLGQSAPSSMRNLIGKVRPFTNGTSPPVLAFVAFPVPTMSTSAKPSTALWTITAMRKLEPTGSRLGSVFQLTVYSWLVTSTRTICAPEPLVVVNLACTCPSGHGDTFWLQISTTGDNRGLKTPVKVGAATIGGSQKKCGLPPPFTASRISAERAGPFAAGGDCSSRHATNATNDKTTRTTRFMARLPAPRGPRAWAAGHEPDARRGTERAGQSRTSNRPAKRWVRGNVRAAPRPPGGGVVSQLLQPARDVPSSSTLCLRSRIHLIVQLVEQPEVGGGRRREDQEDGRPRGRMRQSLPPLARLRGPTDDVGNARPLRL